MTQLYYVELNMACIILLLLVGAQGNRKVEQLSTSRIFFTQMIWVAIVLCLADMISGISRGQFYPGARQVIELSNLLFFEAIVVIGYLWTLYVDCRLSGSIQKNRKLLFLYSVPLIIFTVVAITNPFTHLLFSINADNCYVRNVGVTFHWLISWGYLIYSALRIARELLREKNKLRRQEIKPLLYFIIAPFFASLTQMLFYGVSSTQLGITISIIMIFMAVQGNQVLTDALTGLNNRRGLNNYLEEHIQRHKGEELSLLMIDINHFKSINDKFGHITGDQALKITADLLKKTCRIVPHRPFLCRYGGDEFVVAGIGSRDELDHFVDLLRGELVNCREESLPCKISVSVGKATGKCSCMEDAESLLQTADNAMYTEKKLHINAPD